MGVVLAVPLGSNAAEVNATVTAPVPAVPPAQVSVSATAPAPARLPYAANEVVKLTRAQVSEDVIVSYVNNSTFTSSLSSDDIVRLRNEGVSDRVISAMMDKQTKMIERLPNPAPAPAPVYAETENSAPPVQQPAVAPLTPSSSTYVIPYPAATAAYYGYYSPYYGSYYSPYYYNAPYYGYYGGPTFSFRFGFGGHHGGHHYGHHGHRGGVHVHRR
jgi:hypothetical protein